ncbi:MAG: hypothetical protein MK226_13070 [Saprospiraceae bacterium]|nr:hypothetical protein [Saprospiraceae bacterium]
MRTSSVLVLILILWSCQDTAPASTASDEVKEEVQSEVEDRSQEEPATDVNNAVEEEKKIPGQVMEEAASANPAPSEEEEVIKGHYSYFADVGYFKNCADHQNYLIRLKKSTVKMESDYLRLMKETNEKIFVKIKGQIENTGREKTLIVEEYLGFFPEESCD